MTEIEQIMEKQGCSEPVARNLIKYAKLGIGPLVDPNKRDEELDPGYMPKDTRVYPTPPRIDRRTAALEFEQRLRDREEQEERELEARRRQEQKIQVKKPAVGLQRLGPVMQREETDPLAAAASSASGAFEQPNRGKDDDFLQGGFRQAQPKKKMQFAGIKSLGPVETRQEEVDPLGRDVPPVAPDLPDDQQEEDDPVGESRQEKMRRLLQQDKDTKPRKKRRRKGKDADGRSGESDREGADGPREDSPPPQGGSIFDLKQGRASASGGSLMSEAQVMAMMKGDRKRSGGERGSIRAKTRIQKEMQEWERAKANNPEFWKAPQFALCYSAETGKRQGPY